MFLAGAIFIHTGAGHLATQRAQHRLERDHWRRAGADERRDPH